MPVPTLLFAKVGGKVDALDSMRSEIPKAVERAMEVSYADFKSQVVSYLQPEHMDAYGSREAMGRLQRLRVPAATTSDAAAVLGLSIPAASHTLRRLASSGLVTPVRKALWALTDQPDPLALAEYVTTTYPSYVSLQTALYRRGMITQIPSMIYLVPLARSARIETSVGTYSVHHLRPEIFGGFEHDKESGTNLALPEKALVDFLYLSPSGGRLFAALPELELPRGFSRSAARAWAERIPSRRSRTIVERKLGELLAGRR